jgi:hypothetical protein
MKIILGTFKDEADELAKFLGPRVGIDPSVSAGELDFDDEKVKKTIKSRHVKTYVKRFLNKKGERANYQIQVEGKQLRLIELEKSGEEEEEGKKKKKAAPKAEEKKEEATAVETPQQEAEGRQEGTAASTAPEKVREDATSEREEEEKEEGALDKEQTKKQTKPKRKKGD